MCMIDDAEPWQFYADKIITARKVHRCGECRREIHPGERYRRAVGKIDFTISAYKTCAHCLEAGKWLEVECGGYLLEGMLGDFEEHASEYEFDRSWKYGRVRILAAAMRKQWIWWTPERVKAIAT